MGWYRERVLPRMVSAIMRDHRFDAVRHPSCAPVHGTVLEVGFADGYNIAHYPSAVTRVLAVEPSDLAWQHSQPQRDASSAEFLRVGTDAASIDLADNSVDSALSTFTLCTIADIDAALAEIRRVLRPGGVFSFAEHGLAPGTRMQTAQRVLDPVEQLVGGGCHLVRDIPRLVGEQFDVTLDQEGYLEGPSPWSYLYRGTAR